jgi:hypothetical protein
LFRCTRAEIDAALSDTCRMALARLTIDPSGYEIRTSTLFLVVSLSRRGPAFEIGFRGPWREGKKGRLIRNLIAKQFEPVVPRLRIRTRPAR